VNNTQINSRVTRPIDYVKNAAGGLAEFNDQVSILDIGHGKGLHLKNVKFNSRVEIVGFDVSASWLSESIKSSVTGNAPKDLDLILDSSFDIVMAFDLIEHLSREDGYKLLYHMERIARDSTLDNPFDAHVSGWSHRDFKAFGYTRLRKGARLKFLLGPYSQPKFPILYTNLVIRASLLKALNFLAVMIPNLSYSVLYMKKF
jgi:hypothetical protein